MAFHFTMIPLFPFLFFVVDRVICRRSLHRSILLQDEMSDVGPCTLEKQNPFTAVWLVVSRKAREEMESGRIIPSDS